MEAEIARVMQRAYGLLCFVKGKVDVAKEMFVRAKQDEMWSKGSLEERIKLACSVLDQMEVELE